MLHSRSCEYCRSKDLWLRHWSNSSGPLRYQADHLSRQACSPIAAREVMPTFPVTCGQFTTDLLGHASGHRSDTQFVYT